jgi:hypothetical protein
MDWWLTVGLCGIFFEPCAFESWVNFLTMYTVFVLYFWERIQLGTLWPALPMVSCFGFLPQEYHCSLPVGYMNTLHVI